MGTRLATLNIRHGGSKSAEALAIRLLGYDADILVVTEFRANAVGARLIDRLEQAGYDTSHPAVGPKENTVLIAARIGIERSWAFSESLDPRHLWCAEIDGAYVCGAYMPQNTAKLPYWEALIRDGSSNGIDLLIGDFNTGTNDLDKDPRGAKFIGPEMPGRLIVSMYTDMWRSLHPDVREYSWFSRPGDNGFRLDYVYAAPNLAQRIRFCELDHAPRLTAAEIAALDEDDKPGSVVVAIMTDGMENASHEWSRPAIKSLVEQQTNQFGWQFLYMGADQDAVEVGRDLGVKAEQAVTYGRGKSREAMAAMSGNVRGYRNAKLADADAVMPGFSDEQRVGLADE